MSVDAPQFHNYWEHLAHAAREVPVYLGRHWKAVGLAVATLSIPAAYAINQFISLNSQGRETTKVSDPYKPSNQDSGVVIVPTTTTPGSTPESTGTTAPPPPPTETAVLPTATTTGTPTPDRPKPLPEIINNQTAKFVTPPAEEIKRMTTEAQARGEIRLPLPDIIKHGDLSVQEIHAKNGPPLLAITASEKGTYNLPVILEGKVHKVNAGKLSNFSSFGVQYKDGEVWAYIFPAPGKAFLKEGEPAYLGQNAISVDYDPDSRYGQIFTKFLDTQIGGNVPHNTVALLVRSKTDNNGLDLTFEQGILQTPQGEIVLVSSSAQ